MYTAGISTTAAGPSNRGTRQTQSPNPFSNPPRPGLFGGMRSSQPAPSGHRTSQPSSLRPTQQQQQPQQQSQQQSQQQQVELSEEQREEIREAFELFDLDKDKKIDYHEFKVAMKALGFDEDKQEVLRILRRYGSPAQPGSSRILLGYEAFVQVMGEKITTRDPLEEISRAFSLFAGTLVQTQNGEETRISVDDVRRVAKELGENLEEEEILAMVREFDLDGDGLISKEEFIAICRGE